MSDFDKWWAANRDRFDVDEAAARAIWRDAYAAGESYGRKAAADADSWGKYPDTMGA